MKRSASPTDDNDGVPSAKRPRLGEEHGKELVAPMPIRRALEWALLGAETRIPILERRLATTPRHSVGVYVSAGPVGDTYRTEHEKGIAVVAAFERLLVAKHWSCALLFLEKVRPLGDAGAAITDRLIAAFRTLQLDERVALLELLAKQPGGSGEREVTDARFSVFDAACEVGWVEAVDLLRSQRCYPGDGYDRPSSVHVAVHHNHLHLLRRFLDWRLKYGWYHKEDLLRQVMKEDRTDLIRLIREHPDGVSVTRNPEAWLLAATHIGREDHLREILSHFPEAEWSRLLEKSEALQLAASCWQPQLARRLVSVFGVNVNARAREAPLSFGGRYYERTALEGAVCTRQDALRDFLLLEAGASVDNRSLYAAMNSADSFALLLHHYPLGDTPPLNAVFRHSACREEVMRFLQARWPDAFSRPPAVTPYRWAGMKLHGDEREAQWRRQQAAVAVGAVLPVHWLVDIALNYLFVQQEHPH